MSFFGQAEVFGEDESAQDSGPSLPPVVTNQVAPFRAKEVPVFAAKNEVDQFDQIDAEVNTLSEVEVRLVKANLYRAILDQPLFGNDDDAITREVQDEIRQYTLKRLRQLIGIDQEDKVIAAKALFTDTQVTTLRALADRMAGKLTALATPQVAPVAPQAPQVRSVQVATAPKKSRPRAQTQEATSVVPETPTTVQPTSSGPHKPVPFPSENEQDMLAAKAAAHREFSSGRKTSVIDIALQHLK